MKRSSKMSIPSKGYMVMAISSQDRDILYVHDKFYLHRGAADGVIRRLIDESKDRLLNYPVTQEEFLETTKKGFGRPRIKQILRMKKNGISKGDIKYDKYGSQLNVLKDYIKPNKIDEKWALMRGEILAEYEKLFVHREKFELKLSQIVGLPYRYDFDMEVCDPNELIISCSEVDIVK